jgi:hypothetical protein
MCGSYYSAHATSSEKGTKITLNAAPEYTIAGPPPSFGDSIRKCRMSYPMIHSPFSWIPTIIAGISSLKYGGHGGHLINRMVFVQLVAALEAYLGDTLINTVMGNSDAFSQLVAADRELGKERYSLTEVAADPKFVQTRVRVYLKSVLYHNLEKVGFLYKITTGLELLRQPVDAEKLFKAILDRHDCVHRNGFDKDGRKLSHFTKGYIHVIADEMKGLIEMIEAHLKGLLP